MGVEDGKNKELHILKMKSKRDNEDASDSAYF